MPLCQVLRSPRNQIEGFTHDRGALYQLSHVPSPDELLLTFWFVSVTFISRTFHSMGVKIRATLGSQFFPSTMREPQIELRLAGMVVTIPPFPPAQGVPLRGK